MICNHHADAKVVCQCVATYDAIVAGENIPKADAYVALCRETARHPDLLQGYASDLIVHDRRLLEAYQGPFLWFLYELGSQILVPDDRPGAGTVGGLRSAFGDDRGIWRLWDGRALRPITPDAADEWLAAEVSAMRRTGRKAS